MASNPVDPIHIKIPIPRNETLVTVAFGYGYVAEDDREFGLAHLTEHCLVRAISERLKPKDTWGYINDRYVVISILLTKKSYDAHFADQDIATQILSYTKDVSGAMMNSERSSISLELEEKYGSIFSSFAESVYSIVIASPKALARSRAEQLKNLPRFRISDVENAVERLRVGDRRVFIGACGAVDVDSSHASGALSRDLDVGFSKPGRYPIRTEAAALKSVPSRIVFAFRGLSLKEPQSKRFILGFLVAEIDAVLEKNIRAHGSYQTYYEHYVEKEYGLVWFGATSRLDLGPIGEGYFFGILKELLDGSDFAKKVAAFKKNKKRGLKEDWVDVFERHDWIVEDMLDIGRVAGIDQALRSVDEINVEMARAVAMEVFTKERLYLLR